LKTTLLLLTTAAALLAQIGQPGQYPPGQYPPGRNPGNNNPNNPFPSRGPKNSNDKKDAPAAPRKFSGVIREVGEKSVDVEATDTRVLTFQISDQTTKSAPVHMGDEVDVEATQDKDGAFHALNIKVTKAAAPARAAAQPTAPAEPEPEGRTAAPPTIMVRPDQRYDDGDAGPPKLKRGAPPVREAPLPQATLPLPPPASEPAREAPDAPPPPPVDARKAFLEKARAVALEYVEKLPNYICTEVASRYVSETRVPSWAVVDVVSAEVVYEDRKESYRNVTINGKATKKSPEETGAWSTGEFGTILRNLFEPGTQADFKYAQGDTIAHLPASVYKFTVARARSTWKIMVPGQYIFPAYKGSVWIDKQNGNVLRIEMQARDIPEEFPRIVVESSVDYEYISLGAPEKFLLPVHAEVLSCARGSNDCDRNVIDFRNYHKFVGESTIKISQ
jgi:hypothetical protein